MPEYFIFLDTETSGLPRSWEKPYTDADNWPYIIQIAWLITDAETEQQICQRDFYIQPDGFEVSHQSEKIHGISQEYLYKNGTPRAKVMQLLLKDLQTYTPTLVSHFLQLDYHMLRLGFYRSGLGDPISSVPSFCTMLHSGTMVLPANQRFLRLNELYKRLFNADMPAYHNALADASATAKCFMALKKQGSISREVICKQRGLHKFKQETAKIDNNALMPKSIIILSLIIFLVLLLLWKILQN